MRSRPARLPVRFATLGEIRVYWVYEHELTRWLRGTANALFLNFAIFLLPISITLIVTLLATTIPSDRLFYGFLSVALVTAIAGMPSAVAVVAKPQKLGRSFDGDQRAHACRKNLRGSGIERRGRPATKPVMARRTDPATTALFA